MTTLQTPRPRPRGARWAKRAGNAACVLIAAVLMLEISAVLGELVLIAGVTA